MECIFILLVIYVETNMFKHFLVSNAINWLI